jgi:hypothetical protein
VVPCNLLGVRALLAASGVWLLVFISATAQSVGSARGAGTAGVAQDRSRGAFPGTLDQHPAIDYRGGPLSDVVTSLRRELASGSVTLESEGRAGFLLSVLKQLRVPVESQILVFSKTGIQNAFTSPEKPRALYFNDRVVVGYIPDAPVIELASHDPKQGVIFHTLRQDAWLPAEFARPDRCLGCHLSANSLEVPGILVRSMFTGVDGRAMPQLGSFLIDHRAPLEQRWGGWYVTGQHGGARHMGNAMVADSAKPEAAVGDATLNRSTLIDRVDASAYPKATSDIAALMVFDHQGHAMNLLTRLGWEARYATAEGRADFSKGALGELVNQTVDYLVFADEARLAAPVKGVSDFSRTFAATGPRDRKGRSLRELDLQTRLFKYRCSYMIYSPAFDALPSEARAAIYARMRAIITDRDTIEILDETWAGWR